ncbi:hypothetical protein [Nannocystis radixulma]|uniref:Lipoprotein n=1 Tax=Nannocystis radixulma TaxID=2995305 RepID=A0ABT5B2C9_9BACT|nr:hypothetical protein [Nannocystis radixulma]MDC0667206.1 hypothetical protein [Nannocystis radixulma]
MTSRIVVGLALLGIACNGTTGGGSSSDSGTSTSGGETAASGSTGPTTGVGETATSASTGPTTDDDETTGSGSTGSTTGDGGMGGLRECGFMRDCLLSEHFFKTEPGMPSECAAEFVRSGEPALLVVAPYYVPFCRDWSRIMVLAGDGSVVVQTATADAGSECKAPPTVFEAGPQERCELDLPPDFDTLTEWFPAVKNCVEGEWYDCESLAALLGE